MLRLGVTMAVGSPPPVNFTAATSGYTHKSPQSRPVVNAGKSASSSSVGSLEDVFNQALNQGKTIVKYGWGLWNIGLATVLGIGSAIGATFFKDNTTADIASKIGVVGAIITAIVGLFQIKKTNSEQNKAKDTKLQWSIDETIKAPVRGIFMELSGQAHGLDILNSPSTTTDTFHLINQSQQQKPNPTNSKDTWNLHCYGEQYRIDLINLLHSIPSQILNNGNIYEITGLKGKENIGLNTLKDELAILTGILNATSQNYTFILNNQSEIHNEDSLKLMPEEFQTVYNQELNLGSLSGTVDALMTIDSDILKTVDYNTQGDQVQNYLSAVSDTYNSLRILETACRETINESNSSDPNTLRKIGLYRSALISKYNIKGNSLGEINQKIKDTIYTPVLTELKKLNTHVDKLRDVTSQTETIPFILEKQPHSEFGDLVDFSNKPIAPVSV